MLKSAKYFAEMVRVGETTGIGDPLQGSARIGQHPGSFVNPNLGREVGGGQARPVSEEMTEVGSTHAVLGCEDVDVDGLGQACDDT